MTSHVLPFTTRLLIGCPRLTDDNHKITSVRDWKYNCMAYAVGITATRWWPASLPEYDWPEGVRSDETLEAFAEALGTFGYERCDTGDVEDGVEKIAVYADHGEPMHVALQLETGQWTSKLGGREDIRHDSLDDLRGDGYGSPELFMRRPRATQEAV